MPTEANAINAATTGIVGNTGTAFTGTAVTQYNVIVGGATSSTLTNVAPSATSGIPLVSAGASANPSFTTAVVAGGGTGQTTLTNHGVLVGAGTSAITQLAAGSAGQALLSGGASADPAYSTPTYPSTSGTSGKVLVSDGTNNVYSTPTFPNASATSRKIIVSDGTNWVASTETWATPGTNGNVLTSNGTNWTSAAAAGGTFVKQVRASTTTNATLTTTIPKDNTIPQNTEGTQILSASITPASSSNILLIEANAWGEVSGTLSTQMALFQDSTANALAAAEGVTQQNAGYGAPVYLRYYMTAGTTSSTTFNIRVGPNTATFYFLADSGATRLYGGVGIAVLTITEFTS